MRNRISLVALFAVSLASACGYDPHFKNGGLGPDGGGGAGGAVSSGGAGGADAMADGRETGDSAVDTAVDVPVSAPDSGVGGGGGATGTGGAGGRGGAGGTTASTGGTGAGAGAGGSGGSGGVASGGATAATGGTSATGGTIAATGGTSTDASKVDAANPDVRNTDVGNIDAANIDVSNSEVPVGKIDAANIDVSNSDVPVANIDVSNSDLAVANPDLANIDSRPAPAIVVNLGLAAPFAIAATAGVTNTITAPITHINGNVVLDPNKTCNAVTVDNAGGFGLCGGMPPTISGTVITNLYPDTTTSTAIKAALNAAFLSITPLAGPPAVGTLGGGTPIAAPTTLGNVAGGPLVLGDNWFTPGVYRSITSILITGDITLDGQGDPNAIFIFQSASTLTAADGAPSPAAHTRILLTNGAKASNVWWQVASSATIGSYSEFQGNILAAFDITMKTHATACGRSMAGAWVGGAGAFVFDSNVVSVPGNGCPL